MLRTIGAAPEQCECPDCSGAELDPAALVDDLIASGALLVGRDDPLDVELFAANVLAAGDLAGEGFAEAMDSGIVPAVEQAATPEALAVLLAIASVDDGPAAADAAGRLVAAGVPDPVWAGELREPVRPGTFLRFADAAENLSILVGTFQRGGRSHGFSVNVDDGDCFSAAGILIFPGEVLDEVVSMIQANGDVRGLAITGGPVEPGEFRWQVERALNARADHDHNDPEGIVPELGDETGPGFHLLAVLLRARLRLLPEPPRPPAQHSV